MTKTGSITPECAFTLVFGTRFTQILGVGHIIWALLTGAGTPRARTRQCALNFAHPRTTIQVADRPKYITALLIWVYDPAHSDALFR